MLPAFFWTGGEDSQRTLQTETDVTGQESLQTQSSRSKGTSELKGLVEAGVAGDRS